MFGFTLGVTVLAGLLVWTRSRIANVATEPQRDAQRQWAAWLETGGRNRVGSLLIVSEIALSFILLAGAGLLIKSFMHLREIDPGFNADNVLAMRLQLAARQVQAGRTARADLQTVDRSGKSDAGCAIGGAVLSLPLGGDSLTLGAG